MVNDIPDYMRGFDLDEDFGITPVASKPKSETSVDKKVVESTNLELSKVKKDLDTIKSMMNEVLQVVAEKDSITKELEDTEVTQRFKNIEKVILPFLYNLSKSEEPYIHWPNRGPIIKAQIDKILELTRGRDAT
tara:strand:- start:1129 stop:1530 length:402 start_codon:yes stop_codon:yes gene_type:complete